MAEAIVAAIRKAGSVTTTALRKAVGGNAEHQTDAMERLQREDPPRVVAKREVADTASGRQSAKVWRPFPGHTKAIPERPSPVDTDRAEAIPDPRPPVDAVLSAFPGSVVEGTSETVSEVEDR